MTQGDPDIVVLRQKVHGMGAEEYATCLRDRLPDYDIVRARTPTEEQELLSKTEVATGFTLEPSAVSDRLSYFACVFAGTGHLPLAELGEAGVTVTNASGVHQVNIGEQVLAYLLTFARNLHEGWRRGSTPEWRSYQTRELQGSTVTVVGMGALGEGVVDRLEAFNVHTIGIRHSPSRGGPTDEVYGYEEDIHEAFSRSEYLVVAAPLTDITSGLIDAEVFRTLPADAVLVNVGRGPIVDTEALIDAIQINAIRGAALDVTDPEPLPHDHPLWDFENVVVTPHNAGHTPAYWERMADIVAENIRTAVETGSYDGLRNQVQLD